jgi:hypothetical protein
MWYEPQASNIKPWSKITMRSTDAIIFNMNLNEPKPSRADPSDASFMFVSYTNRNISGSCVEVEPVNSSPYSYDIPNNRKKYNSKTFRISIDDHKN